MQVVFAGDVDNLRLGQKAEMKARGRVAHGEVVHLIPSGDRNVLGVAEFPQNAPVSDPGAEVEIVLDRGAIPDALYISRPAGSQAESDGMLFRLERDGNYAESIAVRFGLVSGSLVQIVSGLKNGERVIVSDMSRWAGYSRLRLSHERPPRDR